VRFQDEFKIRTQRTNFEEESWQVPHSKRFNWSRAFISKGIISDDNFKVVLPVVGKNLLPIRNRAMVITQQKQ
jgi:hypothetical protein